MVHIDNLLQESAAEKDYSDQVQWLVQIFEWLRLAKDVDNNKISRDRVYTVRIKHLLMLFNRNPQWRENFVATISSVITRMSSVNMFTDAGMSLNTSFIQEFIRRLEDKILPQSALTENLSTLLLEVFPDEEDSVLFAEIEEAVFAEVLALFSRDKHLSELFRQKIYLSLFALSTQLLANAFTIHREIEGHINDSRDWPEAKLQEILVVKRTEGVQSTVNELVLLLDQCESQIVKNYELINIRGIKVDFVFLLESQKRRISRINGLLSMLDEKRTKSSALKMFISDLIMDIHHQKSLRSFFAENLNLLTQRIVRRNSMVGEHYVTFDRKEFKSMYQSAVGGGLITSGTVYVKILLSTFGLAGFGKGLFDSLNYATSFVLIQNMGWTLATKQPSATAPYLAESLKHSLQESKRAVVALLRTQFIAVLGNLTLVFPICLGIAWIAYALDRPILPGSVGVNSMASSNILGFTGLYAAFTGVLLFLSSLMAGWFDNWIVVHKLPDRIANHQTILRFMGKSLTKKFSGFLRENANPLAANISLGFLLGLAPQYLKFMGIPLEVRHITLATGNFAASLPTALSQGVSGWAVTNALLGLLLIGFLNITVSFSLALFLASVSSKISIGRLLKLMMWGLGLVLTRPLLLVIPEEADQVRPKAPLGP
jgi:site-specific recombinase